MGKILTTLSDTKPYSSMAAEGTVATASAIGFERKTGEFREFVWMTRFKEKDVKEQGGFASKENQTVGPIIILFKHLLSYCSVLFWNFASWFVQTFEDHRDLSRLIRRLSLWIKFQILFHDHLWSPHHRLPSSWEDVWTVGPPKKPTPNSKLQEVLGGSNYGDLTLQENPGLWIIIVFWPDVKGIPGWVIVWLEGGTVCRLMMKM